MELKQYMNYVEPTYELEEKAREIITDEVGSDASDIEQAFALHHYLYREVEYQHRHKNGRSRDFRDPLRTLARGGNCEEQVVLLASMYDRLYIAYQFVDLALPNRGHLSLRVSPSWDTTDYFDEIGRLARSLPTVTNYDTVLSTTCVIPRQWFLDNKSTAKFYYADPVMGQYLGDGSGLTDKGYMISIGNGWAWDCEAEAYDPETKTRYYCND